MIWVKALSFCDIWATMLIHRAAECQTRSVVQLFKSWHNFNVISFHILLGVYEYQWEGNFNVTSFYKCFLWIKFPWITQWKLYLFIINRKNDQTKSKMGVYWRADSFLQMYVIHNTRTNFRFQMHYIAGLGNDRAIAEEIGLNRVCQKGYRPNDSRQAWPNPGAFSRNSCKQCQCSKPLTQEMYLTWQNKL